MQLEMVEVIQISASSAISNPRNLFKNVEHLSYVKSCSVSASPLGRFAMLESY